ncbi:hypothetical protein CEXT_540091 [Caerostris extrusa]|uniref:Ribosomal protein S10 n=1 Tax=Caerostris extrusa TaxID=172846 RepID=A0AAV4T762_CAEEX|nr:hypothetical protein CEXT_540091 [Caerostris extrusa]
MKEDCTSKARPAPLHFASAVTERNDIRRKCLRTAVQLIAKDVADSIRKYGLVLQKYFSHPGKITFKTALDIPLRILPGGQQAGPKLAPVKPPRNKGINRWHTCCDERCREAN